MSRVQDQIAALTKHLYDQHQAAKAPLTEESVRIVSPTGIVEAVVPRSVPLAPGVHPPAPAMGPRYIPGIVRTTVEVRTVEAAREAIEDLYGREETSFKREYLGKWPEPGEEDDTPSIDQPAEKKKYSRKLEP